MSMPERRYRGVSAQQRRDLRREQLLDAGLELLGSQGWRQATMTAVCARANLTERYFYESFASRDELLLAVLDRIAAQIRDVALRALAEEGGGPSAKVAAAIGAFVDLLTDDPRIGRAAILESAAAEPLRGRRHELLCEFAQLVATQARALYGDDALAPPSDQVNGLMITGGLAELLMRVAERRTARDPSGHHRHRRRTLRGHRMPRTSRPADLTVCQTRAVALGAVFAQVTGSVA